MRIAILSALLGLAVALAGCSGDDPCSDYTSYMCDCHAKDTGTTSCDQLETIYGNASADLQDACTTSLDDQKKQDSQDGYVCGATNDSDSGDSGDTGA